ncbi:bifunctional tetrahydrofolate synthase/dihydrofolate synthase [Vogesella oryzae]|uniref:bifunctional tetrahydrofolate synthase/dihydrofolate synthase n=1 Tax=Vogesella oryzae TaxID=1735285 RepID=UPI0015814016|nr:bifunctional tetrahydrofolate synthase/dihydrofolate synthase [Vogesella oryzae]
MTAQAPANGASLADWLAYLEAAHPVGIDMGLTRVAKVRDAMQLQPAFPLVIVGGTNGKGSVCAMLSTMLNRAGFKVGTYTSPHILRYNERVAIDMQPLPDADIVAGFAAVEAARGDTSLTYFEYGTLAAMHAFLQQHVDVAVLEVGLGGRLDAINVFEPTVSVVVSVDLDHQAYLGDTRELVGFEKAGIYRPGKAAICADPNPPQSLLQHAANIGADLKLLGRDFGISRMENQWSFHMGDVHKHALPIPALRGEYQMVNAATALAVLEALKPLLPVSIGAIKRGLLEVDWPGRFQVLPGRPLTVLDVGHNPHAARALADSLKRMAFANKRIAVFSMLSDKDLSAVVRLLQDEFDEWLVAGLDMPRGRSADDIAGELESMGVKGVSRFNSIPEAWDAALSRAGENDRIVVFGSFHTVAEVMQHRLHHRAQG